MSELRSRQTQGPRPAPGGSDPVVGPVRDSGRPSSPERLTQLAEWAALHHRLSEALRAVAPFASALTRAQRRGEVDAAGRSELYVNWRPCQREVSALVEFAEGVSSIAPPYRRSSGRLSGARWAVEVVALRLKIEGSLAEQPPHLNSLIELVDELRSVCHRHLAIANRNLRDLVAGGPSPTRVSSGT